jgi:hypothetical protein
MLSNGFGNQKKNLIINELENSKTFVESLTSNGKSTKET